MEKETGKRKEGGEGLVFEEKAMSKHGTFHTLKEEAKSKLGQRVLQI